MIKFDSQSVGWAVASVIQTDMGKTYERLQLKLAHEGKLEKFLKFLRLTLNAGSMPIQGPSNFYSWQFIFLWKKVLLESVESWSNIENVQCQMLF